MTVSGSRIGVLLVGAWLSTGCMGTYAAESAFASDFDCPSATAEMTNAVGRYKVHGCGRTASYVCVNNGMCALQTVDESASSRSSSSTDDDPPQPRRNRKARTVASETRFDKNESGDFMKLELVLDNKALLRVTAQPDKTQDLVQLKLIREDSTEDEDECNLDFMVNGQVLKTPKAVASRNAGVIAHRVQIGKLLISEFATASKVSLRACRERWGLDGEQVAKLRGFMDRFQEEMAWKAPARDGSTGGMVAPVGGWPEWKPSSVVQPKAIEGAALEGSALFKKLSPSVFVLEAVRPEGTAQGSAVAVTESELVTNCHVVQAAQKLTLKQGKQQWPAQLLRADPASDRCTITAQGAKLKPVAGVRSYDSLEVGEPAYTLGSPVGLELTLSNGIVSGRREEDGRNYVQTTAPISPGSSGGGLFDARGNLIGVTTLVLVGREHLNQSLNFAIPADAYFETTAGKASF